MLCITTKKKGLFFHTGDFENYMIDIHSSVWGNSHVLRAGKPCMVSSVQWAAPVYSGCNPTSVHLPVSQSSDSMTVFARPLKVNYRKGRVLPGPAPAHKSLLLVTYTVISPNTIKERVSFSLIGRLWEDATGTYNETHFSVTAFNSIWLLPVAENSLSHTCTILDYVWEAGIVPHLGF